MAQPQVTWYLNDNTTSMSNWNIGTVDAGSTSPITSFLIWNNRSQGTAVSPMTNCVITSRDTLGGLNGNVLVPGQWVQVKCDSLNESVFAPIGSLTTDSINYTPVEHAIAASSTAFSTACTAASLVATDYTSPIGGFVNDGTLLNASANFAKVELQVVVPQSAPAGSIDFLTRVRYSYI